RRCVPGESQDLLRVRNGFEVVGLRATGDQNEVSYLCRSEGRLFGTGRGVYDREIHPVLLGLFKGGGQPGGLCVDDDRAVAFSAVLPVAGRGLRVEIKNK